MQSETGHVVSLYRYPVKGFGPDALSSVELQPHQTFPLDRAYAIENGPSKFDPAAPRYAPKSIFLMLMRDEALATLNSHFDADTHTLHLSRKLDGAPLASGDLRTAHGRAAIEDAMVELFGSRLRGRPRVLHAEGHSFSDVSAKCVHIVNMASVRALESVVGRPVDPVRFRPNIVVDGLTKWTELMLAGGMLNIGGVALKVTKRTERCPATNVDPATGARDMQIPAVLQQTYGHTDFGIYATVVSGGTLAQGDAVQTLPPRTAASP